jgi:putative ABC transport system permease protein
MQNLRFALRSLAKTPGFTAVALCTLALGIGINTAIFSLLDSVLFRPLAFPDSDRLVRIWATAPERGIDQTATSYLRFDDYRTQQQVFENLAVDTFAGLSLVGAGAEAEQLAGGIVSSQFFQTLGVRPQIGRVFAPEDDRPGAPRVAVISHGLWQRRFGGSPEVLHQTVQLNGQATAIIGVLPANFGFPFDQRDAWLTKPFEVPGLTEQQVQNGAGYLNITARLKPGVSLEQAAEAIRVIAARYAAANPGRVDANFGTLVLPFHEELVGNQRPAFYTLFAAVGVVLLIACANVANLLLTRFADRAKEIAVRMALGANRSRIIRQFLTETVLLTASAAVLGLLLASWSLDALVNFARDFIPRAGYVGLDWRALGFTAGLALVTGVAMGLFPAWQVSAQNIVESLKDAAKGSTGGVRSGRFRTALLVAEVALSFVLLVGASLLILSFARLRNVDAGFRADGVLSAFVSLPPARYDTPEKQAAFYSRLQEELAALPGVASVALGSNPPLSGNQSFTPYAIKGRPLPPLNEQPLGARFVVSPGYFSTLGIPVRQGRDFDPRDRSGARDVVIVNEAFVRDHFPGGDALGQVLVLGVVRREFEIVGIIGDHRALSLSQPAGPQIYFSALQRPENVLGVMLRTAGDPAALTPALRQLLRQIDADLPLISPQPLTDFLEQSLAGRELNMLLLAGFAALAIVLSGLGIYSVMAYAIALRSPEIGVRMALGASPGAVQRMVIGQGLRTAGIGLAVGVVGAFAATRLLSSQLFGIEASHPLAYAGIAVFVLLVSLLACWLPARRASRIDPLVALRRD